MGCEVVVFSGRFDLDPRVSAVARALGARGVLGSVQPAVARLAVVGALCRLFAGVLAAVPPSVRRGQEDAVVPCLDSRDLDDLAGLPGLVDVMVRVGWVELVDGRARFVGLLAEQRGAGVDPVGPAVAWRDAPADAPATRGDTLSNAERCRRYRARKSLEQHGLDPSAAAGSSVADARRDAPGASRRVAMRVAPHIKNNANEMGIPRTSSSSSFGRSARERPGDMDDGGVVFRRGPGGEPVAEVDALVWSAWADRYPGLDLRAEVDRAARYACQERPDLVARFGQRGVVERRLRWLRDHPEHRVGAGHAPAGVAAPLCGAAVIEAKLAELRARGGAA